MRYCEGQVGYYGKKRMSFLGIMWIRWQIDGEVSGFEYSFVDNVIKGYSGQDHVQVADVIQLDFITVQDRHPAEKKVIIQSNNANVFDSQ